MGAGVDERYVRVSRNALCFLTEEPVHEPKKEPAAEPLGSKLA